MCVIPALGKKRQWRSGVQGHYQLCIEFKSSLGNIRPFLKKTKRKKKKITKAKL